MDITIKQLTTNDFYRTTSGVAEKVVHFSYAMNEG